MLCQGMLRVRKGSGKDHRMPFNSPVTLSWSDVPSNMPLLGWHLSQPVWPSSYLTESHGLAASEQQGWGGTVQSDSKDVNASILGRTWEIFKHTFVYKVGMGSLYSLKKKQDREEAMLWQSSSFLGLYGFSLSDIQLLTSNPIFPLLTFLWATGDK